MIKRLLFFVCILVCLAVVSVHAAPTDSPSFFRGVVLINGAAAPDNTLITAKIDGKDVAAVGTLNGKYGYAPQSFYITDPDSNRNGKTVEFFVNGVKGGQGVYSNMLPQVVDLSITVATPVKKPSGGGGSDNDDDSPPKNTTNGTQSTSGSDDTIASDSGVCVADWVCSDWLDCVNGEQKRVCVDGNRCDNDATKPSLIQECTVTKRVEEERKTVTNPGEGKTFFSSITGAVLGGGTGSWIALIVVIGIIGAAIFFVYSKSLKKKRT